MLADTSAPRQCCWHLQELWREGKLRCMKTWMLASAILQPQVIKRNRGTSRYLQSQEHIGNKTVMVKRLLSSASLQLGIKHLTSWEFVLVIQGAKALTHSTITFIHTTFRRSLALHERKTSWCCTAQLHEPQTPPDPWMQCSEGAISAYGVNRSGGYRGISPCLYPMTRLCADSSPFLF